MKLYDYAHAPNPGAAIFLAEKGLEMERVQIDLTKKEQLSPEYREVNPLCQVPVLETDDGTRISECLAICRYLEDLHPEPNLFGSGPDDRAQVLMWNHIVEQEGMPGLAEALATGSTTSTMHCRDLFPTPRFPNWWSGAASALGTFWTSWTGG